MAMRSIESLYVHHYFPHQWLLELGQGLNAAILQKSLSLISKLQCPPDMADLLF